VRLEGGSGGRFKQGCTEGFGGGGGFLGGGGRDVGGRGGGGPLGGGGLGAGGGAIVAVAAIPVDSFSAEMELEEIVDFSQVFQCDNDLKINRI
jgi:hypothetical protein